MPKFRKKPVIVNAFQMTALRRMNRSAWPDWLLKALETGSGVVGSLFLAGPDTFIITLEGIERVSDDDWIIQGVKGELYPCKPDIFELTYENVDEANAT